MKIRHLAPLGLLLLLLSACFAPSTSVTPVDPTATAQEQTPHSIVTATLVSATAPASQAAPEPTARSEPKASPDGARLSLPNVVLNIGSWGAYPLYECREHALPAQILMFQFPYTTFTTLANDADSSAYYPMWSPNGDWIAYVLVKNQKPIVTVPYDQPVWDYPDSDSVWIMRPDGSEKRQLSGWFPRREGISLHSSGPACDVGGGILSLEGWSEDNQWITFTHWGSEGATLYALNTFTGGSQTVETGILTTRWAPLNDDLALTYKRDGTTPILKVVNMEAASSTPAIYVFPAEMRHLEPIAIQWTKDGAGIFVLAYNQNSRPYREEIWRLNTTSQQWDRIIPVVTGDVSFGGNHAVGFDAQQTQITVCGRKYLGFQSISSAQITGEIDFPGFIDCRLVSYLKDATGNELISFVSSDGRNLYVSSIQGGKALPVLNLDELHLSDRHKLSQIVWQP